MFQTSARHIAVIPDGNRTWAKQQGLPTIQGHLQGQQQSFELMQRIFSHTQIDAFTIWGLSTENLLSRSQEELDYLAMIYESAIDEAAEFMTKHKISLRWIGSPIGMTKRLVGVLQTAVKKLTFQSDKTICLGINYGGRDEILRGIEKWKESGAKSEELTQSGFEKYLDLSGLPPVDYVIRTKSEMATRLSGYLLWWIAYAELYFTSVLFPDFTIQELQKSLKWFETIQEHRNFGK